MKPDAILLHADDNVAVATRPLRSGEAASVGDQTVQVLEDIPRGHKLAVREIAKGEAILKYGEPIGIAKADIPKGSHVHVHNLDSGGE